MFARAGTLLSTRAIIAHHPVKRSGTSRKGRAVYVYSIYIEPSEEQLGRTFEGLQGAKQLDALALRKHANAVAKLKRDIAAFRLSIRSSSS